MKNQGEMVALLRESGFEVTQASVSRDIRELGLVKLQGRYVRPEAIQSHHSDQMQKSYNIDLVSSITPIGANLIVLRTQVGAASVVAAQLDRMQLVEIAGTLAGDDTVLVVVPSRSAQGGVLAALKPRPRP